MGATSGPTRAPHWREDLATFLLIRGPFAWIGQNWAFCPSGGEPVGGPGQMYERPAALDEDYGFPLGLCKEMEAGVFQRSWSKAVVHFDCSTGRGSIEPTVAPL